MPAWKGWNEVDVRQSQRGDQMTRLSHMSSTTLIPDASSSTLSVDSSAIPATMGFTAINAPNPNGKHVSGTASSSKQEHKGPSAKHDNDGARQTRLMVAEYLGRGDVEIAPLAAPRTTRVTRGSEAKKRATASKKRAATTNEQSTSKRRKSSIIVESMPVTKPASSTSKGKGNSSNGQAASTVADVAEDIPSQPVSLFSSSTSMETLAAPSQQTSMDAVKTSQGFGTTVYRGPQSTAGVQATSKVAQPWLDRKPAKSRRNHSVQRLPGTVGGREVAKNSNVQSVEVHQQGKPSTGDVDSSKTVEDDFAIGEEEGFEEVMALADSLEARRKLHKDIQHPAGRHNTSQTRKPKPKQKNNSTGSSYQPGPIVQLSRTVNESFIIGEDEDLDQAMALSQRTEAGSLSRDKQASQSLKRKKSSGTVEDQVTGRRKSTLADDFNHRTVQASSLDENFILVEDEDGALIEDITRATEEAALRRSPTPPTRQWKLNMREVDEDEDYGGALFSEAERQILDSIKASQQNSIKPIVRPAFPRPILDRSRLFGASSATTLRTCFRIGEALKEGSMSVRMNSNVVIELYARVVYSRRQGRKQHFVFHDLYHDRHPYLEGTCGLWDQTKLWELDTRSFLGAERDGEGVICRAVAKMKRKDGAAGKGWRLDVLSIWEARWEDVEFVAGIYCKDRREGDDKD